MPRGPPRLNAAALLDDGGRVAALSSLVCFDHLDGIDCFARASAQRPEVVIVPIVYSTAADEATRAIVSACLREREALEAAGLRVEADVDLKRCPGFKFNKHEERHVPVRIEIGAQELEAGTLTLVDCTAPERARTTLASASQAAADACRRIAGAAAAASCRAAPCGRLHLDPSLCSTELRRALGVSRGGCGAAECPRRHASTEEARAAVETAYPGSFGRAVVGWGTRRELRGAPRPRGRPEPAAAAPAEPGAAPSEASPAPRGKRAPAGPAKDDSLVVLFVSGIDQGQDSSPDPSPSEGPKGGPPLRARQRAYNGQLRSALAPYGQVAKLKFAVGVAGRLLGWAHIWLRPNADGAADRAIAELDGQLVVGPGTVRLSHTAGRADALFPTQPFEVRSALRIDAEAAYSVADEPSASAMASFLGALCSAAPKAEAAALRATDGAACAGGCAAALARRFGHLTAVEVDASRAADLRHNLGLLLGPSKVASVEVLAGDYSALWRALRQDLVFLDPPWGGAQYGQRGAISALPLGSTSVEEIAVDACPREGDGGAGAPVLALRLPRNYTLDDLVRRASGAGGRVAPEGRGPTLAFRAEFGSCVLLALCYTDAAARRPFGLALRDLDAAMASLAAWDRARRGEHSPAFWDWDTDQWIKCARWRPAGERRRRPKVPDPPA